MGLRSADRLTLTDCPMAFGQPKSLRPAAADLALGSALALSNPLAPVPSPAAHTCCS
jgi:hypothetical protein